MNPDTIAIIIAIVGSAIALGTALVPGQRELRRDVAELRQCMARLEGLFEGFTRGEGRSTPDRA